MVASVILFLFVTSSVDGQCVPGVSISTTTSTICPGSSITFTATPLDAGTSPVFQWKVNGVNNGTNSSVFTSSTLNNNDLISVELTPDPISCPDSPAVTSNSIIITVNDPVAVITPSGATTFCQGGYVILTSSFGSNYLWSTGALTQSITVTSSGSYFVTVTDANGCSATSTPTSVTVNPLPVASITPSGPTTFCQGGSVVLTSSIGSSHVWNTGAIAQAITVSSSGSYSVTVTDANGCSATSTPTSVTVNPLPVASITPSGPTTFCQGGSVLLTSSPGSSYLWTTGAITQAITVSSSGYYSVTVTDGNGCSGAATSTSITVNVLPVVTSPSSVCVGSTATLSPTTGGAWTSSNTAIAIVTNAGLITGVSAGNVTFSFTSTTTGCSRTTPSVTVVASPAITSPVSVCVGSTATLSPTTGGTWTSSNSANATVTNAGVITGVSPGNVTFTFTSSTTGCSSSTSPVTINSLPIVTAPASVCVGSTATLTPTTGGTWMSSNNARATVTNSGVITGLSSGNVTFTFTNATTGCSRTTPTVTVNSLPSVNSISGPASVCTNNNITLTNTTPGGVWSSSNTEIATISNTGIVSGLTSGTVTIYYSVTNANGCTRVVNKPVTVNSTTVTITPAGPTTFCRGASVTLTASGANTYTWSPGDGLSITTGTTVIATPEITTTYIVTGIGANLCTGTSQVTVTVNQRPEGIMSSDPAVCSGNNSGTVSLTITDGSTVIGWESSINGGTIWSSYTPAVDMYSTTYVNLTQTTVYRALLGLNGCQGYSSIGIIPVNNVLKPIVTASTMVSCLNTAVVLHASGYGQPPFPVEDFQNANPAGWSGDDAGANNGDPNSNWALTNNGKAFNGRLYNSQAPPTNSKFFIVTGITDEADHNATISAPPFSLVGTINPELSFYTALNYNAGTTGTVQISTDGGITYTSLITYTGPRDFGNTNNGWQHVTFSLVPYINQPDVRIRFNYTGTAGSNWGLDNIGIISTFQPIVYHWSPPDHMSPPTGDTPDVTILPDVGLHQYCVSSTTAAGCESDTVCITVNVLPLPVCNITGTDEPACTSSVNFFTAPSGMSRYAWSLTGNGSITSGGSTQTVTVRSGANCNSPFTLTLSITDGNGCVSTCSKTISVIDNTAPVITIPPGSLTLTCFDTASVSAWTATAGAIDACSGPVAVTATYTAPAGSCNQAVTVTFSSTDACGNRGSATKDFIINDNVAPTITCTSNQVVDALSGTTYIKTGTSWDAVATDNCGTPSFSFALSGATTANGTSTLNNITFNEGVTIVTWTVTDNCGNNASCSFSVTVNASADLSIIKTANPFQGIAGQTITYSITVTNQGPSVARNVVITDNITTLSSVAISTDGINYSAWGGTYTLPALASGSNIIIFLRGTTSINQCSEITNTASVTNILRDDVPSNNTVTISTAIQDRTTPVITYCPVARSISGCSVTDITGPSYSTIQTSSSYSEFSNAINQGVASDNCGIREVYYQDVSTGTCTITVLRTWIVRDATGNETSCVQTLTIRDNTPPVIANCPQEQTFCATPGNIYTIPSGISATDNCNGIIVISYQVTGATIRNGSGNDASGLFNIGSSTITWSISDSCGNISTCTTIVTINPVPVTSPIYHR